MGSEHLIFVPARIGSETIIEKNQKLIGEWPLWRWAAEAGRFLGLQDPVVSSDSEELLDQARRQGFQVHVRPPHLNDGPVNDLIVNYVEGIGYKPEWVWLFQPTSPFVSRRTVEIVLSMTKNDRTASIQSVTALEHNCHWMNQREMQGFNLDFIFPIHRLECGRKQDKPYVWRFGNLVVTRYEQMIEQGTMFATPSAPIEVTRWEAIDVDGPEDLMLARLLYKEGIVGCGSQF
jgi:CMP-N-acetylneuraminic acid synthetase|tara:strand:+ start:23 stop:721 length:699 start_codon:yes stop_codon:yes gene_type:complete